jgi:hypothetical protein
MLIFIMKANNDKHKKKTTIYNQSIYTYHILFIISYRLSKMNIIALQNSDSDFFPNIPNVAFTSTNVI